MSAQSLFLSAPRFAVVGASKDQRKFGTRVLKWYQDRKMDVIPVHHKETELEGLDTIDSLAKLPHPTQTSVSIITPAPITLELLKAADELKIPSIWLQPGAEDEEVVRYIEANGLTDRVAFGGPCILRDGDEILAGLGEKNTEGSRL